MPIGVTRFENRSTRRLTLFASLDPDDSQPPPASGFDVRLGQPTAICTHGAPR